MPTVTRLVTLVDLDDRVVSPEIRDAPIIDGPAPAGYVPAAIPIIQGEPEDEPGRISFSVLHQAVLDDGRRVTLLDDRGWVEAGPPDLWERTSGGDIATDARTVVGPDEAYGGQTQADMAAEHWMSLADGLRLDGVIISEIELSRLPHDVELTKRVRDRLGRS